MTARRTAVRVPAGAPPRGQRGLALVIVLCLVLLMSVIAAGHARNAHVETTLALRQVEATRARHLSEAAVNLAILEMLHSELTADAPADGRLRKLRLDDHDLVLSVRQASGLVDINYAAEALLGSVFAAAGAEQPVVLAAAVADWRDPDDLRHVDGAEAGDYAAAGLPWPPANRPFTSVDELRFVLGMPADVFRKSAPYLTTHSRSAGLDLDLAPEFLIEAVAGAELVQQQRSSAARVRVGTFHINVAVLADAGVLVSCEAVVFLTGKGEDPFVILEWRDTSRLLAHTGDAEES